MDISTLSQTDQDLLNAILKKAPDVLTADEVRVLNARAEYLDNNQSKTYKGVMKQQAQIDADLAAEDGSEGLVSE